MSTLSRMITIGLAILLVAEPALALERQRGGGERSVSGSARTSVNGASRANTNRASANRENVNRSNVNRQNIDVSNTNVSRNVNVNVEGNGGGWYDDDDYHPFATAAAVTAGVAMTSAIIGSITRTVPANCVPVAYGGVTYQQCGATWYQPQYAGTTMQYVVVNPPY